MHRPTPGARPSPAGALARGEAHVWRASLDVADDELEVLGSLLARDELERARTFVRELDRRRFVAGRAVLRILLGRYVGDDPAALPFAYGPNAKPHLASPTARVEFNVSHAGPLVLLAFTRGIAVGVDVERIRDDVDSHRIASRFFSGAERDALRTLPEPTRTRAFFACWVRKEAYVKACGAGLSQPLQSFDVSVDPATPAALLRARDPLVDVRGWSLRDLDVGPGYVAALALAATSPRVQLLDYGAEEREGRSRRSSPAACDERLPKGTSWPPSGEGPPLGPTIRPVQYSAAG